MQNFLPSNKVSMFIEIIQMPSKDIERHEIKENQT